MTIEELRKLIAAGEGRMVEVKETTGQRVEACRTLCAFLNGNGGMVVFGVTKSGKLTGQLVSDETKQNLARAFLDLEPGTEIGVEYVDIDATHKAIVCTVEQGARRPYVYDGRPYKRVESSTVKMPQEEYEALLSARKGFVSDWDFSPGRELTMEDLDTEEVVRTARIAVAAGRLDPSADLSDVPSLLRKLHLMKGGRLLNGAAVLFGKDFTFYPQCHMKLAWFRGTTKMEFLDTGSVHGNVFVLFDAAMTFLFKHLNMSGTTSGKMERDEKLELPPDALREALINALAHRSYTQAGGAVSIAVYDDRVEITNPGMFPPEIDMATVMDGNEHESLPRNERIADVLYMRKTIEAWGRGMRLIHHSCADAGVPPPVFTCDGHFVKATFARPSPTIQKNPTIQKAPTIQKNPTAGERPKGRGKAFEGVTTEAVIDVIRAKNTLSMKEMAHILGMSEVGIKYQMTLLSRRGRIRRVGGRKNGHWEETGYASPQFSESVDSRKTKVGGEAAEKQSEKRGRQTEMRGDASGGPARRTIKRTIKRSTKQLTNARVLDVIVRNPGVARPQIAIMIGRGLSATAKALSELQQSGKIEHRGSKKTGGYYAKETP